jgi:acetyl esterase/lipase
VSIRQALGSRKRWLIAIPLLLMAAALWFWPARRNFYGKLGDLDVRLDQPYASPSTDPKQQLDLYLPRGRTGFPLVVFVHGGYWAPLDRRWLEPLIGTHGNLGAALAHRGIGAAVVGYRQYPQIQRGQDSLDDIARAVRFVSQNAARYGADPGRLFLVGHSAGGHLVSLLALDPRLLERHGVEPSALAGFVSIDGIFDLSASLRHFSAEQAQIMRRLFGPDDAALAELSTTSYLGKTHAPLLVVDSTADEAVCREGFQALRAKLEGRDDRARFVELEGLGHNEIIVRAGMSDDPLTPLLARFVSEVSARPDRAR